MRSPACSQQGIPTFRSTSRTMSTRRRVRSSDTSIGSTPSATTCRCIGHSCKMLSRTWLAMTASEIPTMLARRADGETSSLPRSSVCLVPSYARGRSVSTSPAAVGCAFSGLQLSLTTLGVPVGHALHRSGWSFMSQSRRASGRRPALRTPSDASMRTTLAKAARRCRCESEAGGLAATERHLPRVRGHVERQGVLSAARCEDSPCSTARRTPRRYQAK